MLVCRFLEPLQFFKWRFAHNSIRQGTSGFRSVTSEVYFQDTTSERIPQVVVYLCACRFKCRPRCSTVISQAVIASAWDRNVQTACGCMWCMRYISPDHRLLISGIVELLLDCEIADVPGLWKAKWLLWLCSYSLKTWMFFFLKHNTKNNFQSLFIPSCPVRTLFLNHCNPCAVDTPIKVLGRQSWDLGQHWWKDVERGWESFNRFGSSSGDLKHYFFSQDRGHFMEWPDAPGRLHHKLSQRRWMLLWTWCNREDSTQTQSAAPDQVPWV